MKVARRLLVLAVLLLAQLFQAATAGAQTTPPAPPGLDIAAIARENGKTEAEVRQILADRTSRVDRRNRIYYVDPAPEGAVEDAGVEAAPYPYSQTFLLHSRPASQRKIYLDFNGHTVSNTQWSTEFNLPASFYAEPFSLDADGTTFTSAEQDIIQSVWQRVAEDYAPFDVDVTTQDPGFDAINRSGTADLAFGTRALITDATEIGSTCGCGGIAYLGVFDEPNAHSRYQPAFVFPPNLSDSAKSIAEAATHEVGHNFDLSHDGTASVGYYNGHGAWAPIMGVGYYKPISQWSRGEYSGANNTQDDLAIIPLNGAPLLADDHGNTTAAARALGAGPNVSASGIITTDADVDVFRVDNAAGPATFSVSPAPNSPNLDIRLELRNGAGTLLAANDPVSAMTNSSVASGMSASLSVTLAAGPHYLWVSGVGAGSPATTGYSGYGSIGRYSLSGTVTTGTTARTLAINNAAVTEGATAAGTTATFTITLSSASTSTVSVLAATANGSAIAGSDYTAVSTTVSFPAGTTSRTVAVPIIGDAVAEYNETFTVNLSSPSGATLSDGQGVGTINNDDGPPNDNFTAARAISGASGTLTLSSAGATKEAGEPNHASNAGGKSIWYRWTAPATGTVTIDTFGSNFDTLLGVYTGTAVNALTTVASNDDSNGGYQSSVTFTATSGVTYRIAVDGYSAASGNVKLNWLQGAAGTTAEGAEATAPDEKPAPERATPPAAVTEHA